MDVVVDMAMKKEVVSIHQIMKEKSSKTYIPQ